MLIGYSYVFFGEMQRSCAQKFLFLCEMPEDAESWRCRAYTPELRRGSEDAEGQNRQREGCLPSPVCCVAPALTRGCPLFRDFPKSHMAGDVARTLVLTLKVSLTLWTLRILECSLYNCPLVSKGDRFQDPCGCPSSRILWPSRRSGQRLSTTCLCTRIQCSARRGANSGFAFGNFLHF